MPYEPPSGWVERRHVPAAKPALDDREQSRFHLRRDCTLIQDAQQLLAVDRPYSASRCSRCAPD
jgi:hypothetical protein